MPIPYLRRLTSTERSASANRHLARYLAFTAGATNAGGFLAVAQYTSHMTGIVSAMADHLALGEVALMLNGLGALLAFTFGAACSAMLIHWARRSRLQSEYAAPLLLQALLLTGFGLLGSHLHDQRWLFVPVTVFLLCFIMGLQNAMITKLSRAEIRTTHVTGLVTDIGIEVGKLLYWNRHPHAGQHVAANRDKLGLLSSLVGLFFSGGVVGALGFKHLGYIATLPLAVLLLVLAAVPVWDELRARVRPTSD